MLEPGDRLVVAVSGGPDSVALHRLLSLLSDEYRLHLTAAHLNHGLRKGEADEEEAFVRGLCDGMGIACICKRVDMRALRARKRGSLEEVCREERYRFLAETAEKCGAGKIAVGHHRDDQAETVLLHLLRGSGPEGLRGILPVREGRIIRPLLEVGRSDILAFLAAEGLPYRIDSSNASPLFLRNRIRNELIPRLAAVYNPRLVEGLCHTAGIIRQEDDYLRGVVRRTLRNMGIPENGEEVALPVADFCALHEAIQGRIIKALLEAATPEGNAIGYRHIGAVLALAHEPGHRPATLDLPFRIRIEREGGMLRIRREKERKARKRKNEAPPRFEYPVDIPATIHLREIGRSVKVAWTEKPRLREMKQRPAVAFMDFESMTPPLVLRNMRPGDRVALLGSGGTRKLKDYFIDRKIAADRRGSIPLLADAGSIVWIAGERICERVRVTGKTRKVLRAELVDSVEPSEII
ncbi:MAG: tRNA lysidine(34) synthetase TilS [Deltaproteobacteria bacterium]|nr:tRNA lysidine(34) synthetase TilS [Deltaproteobacteria bacterium]